MDFTLFAIVITTLCILIVVMSSLYFDYLPTAKAGHVGNWHFRFGIDRAQTNTLNVNGENVDVSGMPKYIVRGESMKQYGIHSGQTIFVERINKEQASTIEQHPVLLFSIRKKHYHLCDSRYKLRKYIGTIDDIKANADTVFEQYRERIDVSLSDFQKDFNERIKDLRKEPDYDKKKYILSVTYRKKERRNHYNMHSTDTVRGVVKYVL